jgi:hypothetical protein
MSSNKNQHLSNPNSLVIGGWFGLLGPTKINFRLDLFHQNRVKRNKRWTDAHMQKAIPDNRLQKVRMRLLEEIKATKKRIHPDQIQIIVQSYHVK